MRPQADRVVWVHAGDVIRASRKRAPRRVGFVSRRPTRCGAGVPPALRGFRCSSRRDACTTSAVRRRSLSGTALAAGSTRFEHPLSIRSYRRRPGTSDSQAMWNAFPRGHRRLAPCRSVCIADGWRAFRADGVVVQASRLSCGVFDAPAGGTPAPQVPATLRSLHRGLRLGALRQLRRRLTISRTASHRLRRVLGKARIFLRFAAQQEPRARPGDHDLHERARSTLAAVHRAVHSPTGRRR